MSRKAKARLSRNIGPFSQEVPDRDRIFDAVTMPERLLRRLLADTIDKLKSNRSELERFFAHFFDASVSLEERTSFVDRFISHPPRVILGYARSGAVFPCFAIAMEGESEADNLVGDFIGQHDEESEEREPSEFTGAMWEATYAVNVYAQHPDEVIYLYHFAKAIIYGGKPYLMSLGVSEVGLMGADLMPDENYMPADMFVRVLRVTMKVQTSQPQLLAARPGHVRVSGVFASDVVVDGQRGGVKTFTPEEPDEQEE